MSSLNRIKDDASVASRYLADQLTEPEQQAYEQHLVENPEALQELEATARMKVGMAHLRDTGRLEALLRTEPQRHRANTWAAIAASIAIVAIGALVWNFPDVPRDAFLVASSGALVDGAGRPLRVGDSYALLRMRSVEYDAQVRLPAEAQAIELRVRPESPAQEYRATLSAIREDGSVAQVAAVENLRADREGFVRLYVASSRLSPGPYLLVLSAAQEQPGEVAASSFRLKVTRGAGR